MQYTRLEIGFNGPFHQHVRRWWTNGGPETIMQHCRDATLVILHLNGFAEKDKEDISLYMTDMGRKIEELK